MIIITVRNGLGNQLFIYAFGVYLKNKYPDYMIKFDFSDLHKIVNGRKTLQFNEIINQPFEELSDDEVRHYYGKKYYKGREANNDHRIDRVIKRRLDRIFKEPEQAIVIDEPIYWKMDDDFIKKIAEYDFKKDEDYLLRGFWESTAFVLPIQKKIKENLLFINKPLDNELLCLIKESESVSVHIRRGDYIKESLKKGFPRTNYNICGETYYRYCINGVSMKIKNPLFIFFSDDPEYVEKTYKWVSNKIVIHNHPDYDDLQMMTFCKHSVLSNSTFAFWGAFLRKEEGITFAPKFHYIQINSEVETTKKEYFYIPKWLYVENELF